jgi:nucleoside-diphosphate-sugar epimerase
MSDRFVRDYVHVDDVAEALIAAATTTSTQTFLNVASGVAIDNLALAGAARDRSYIPAEPLRSFSVGDPRLSESALKWRSSRSALADVARSRPGG